MRQINTTLRLDAYFTADGVGASGLTTAVDVWSPSKTKVVSNGAGVEVAGGNYYYDMSSALNNAEGAYFFKFKSTNTALDQREVAGLVEVGKTDANLTQWRGTQPLALDVTNRVQAISTGLVAANVVEVLGEPYDGDYNYQVNVTGINGLPLNDPVGGNLPVSIDTSALSVSIKASGITRDSFAPVAELSAMPVFPMNPLDSLTLLYERAFHKNVTTETTDTFYKSNGISPLGIATIDASDTEVDRSKYEAI